MAGGPSFAAQKFPGLGIPTAFEITSPTPGHPITAERRFHRHLDPGPVRAPA